jgi:hypothetical protein
MNDSALDSTPPSLSRRTIVRGAAWATPVIALSVAAPAHATSQPLTISFDTAQSTTAARTTYSTPIAGRVNGATTSVSVSLTLPTGWAFVSGSTAFTIITTATDGTFRIPAGSIQAPPNADTGTLTASAVNAGTAAHTLIATAQAAQFFVSDDYAIAVFTHTGMEIRTMQTSIRSTRMAMSPDMSTLYTVQSPSGSENIYHLDPETGAVITSVPVGPLVNNAEAMSLLPDGSGDLLISRFEERNTFYRLNPSTGAYSPHSSIPGGGAGSYGTTAAIMLPDGRILSALSYPHAANGGVYNRIYVGSTHVTDTPRTIQGDLIQPSSFTSVNGELYAVTYGAYTYGLVLKVNVVGDDVTFDRAFKMPKKSLGIAGR